MRVMEEERSEWTFDVWLICEPCGVRQTRGRLHDWARSRMRVSEIERKILSRHRVVV